MELGDRIKYLRAKRHWTQHELARAASLTRSHISHLENNKIPNPGAAAIRNLAKAFEVPEDIFLLVAQEDLPAIFSVSIIDTEQEFQNPPSMTPASLIFDSEMRRWLTPQILNRLNSDTIRAIVAIIRDAVEENQQPEEVKERNQTPIESSCKKKQIECNNLPEHSSIPSRNEQVRDYSSFWGPGGFVMAL